MDECCDICGDIGVVDALVTCKKCKSSCEHMYCMRTLLVEYPDVWYCEICESTPKSTSNASCPNTVFPSGSKLPNPAEVQKDDAFHHGKGRKLPNGARKGCVDWEKGVASGKTKYICVKEAITLSSGANKSLIPQKVTRRSSPPRPKAMVNKRERTPIRRKTASVSFSSQLDFSSGPMQQLKPQRLFEGQQQRFTKLTDLQRSARSLQPTQIAVNEVTQKGQPAEVEFQHTNTKVGMKDASCSSAPSHDAPPIALPGGNGCTHAEPRACDNENLNNGALPDSRSSSWNPASDVVWKGSFRIKDDVKHGELNRRFQAHPPYLVRKKIYEFSKRMPEVLDFELVPRDKLWTPLFREYYPDRRDVGLYFLPNDGERDVGYLSSLMEAMSGKNLALRRQIGDVELLVFTSDLLSLDCQYNKGNKFLWGVFHPLKGGVSASVCSENVGPKHNSPAPHPDDTNCGYSQVDGEDVDMEIDMVGGVDIGKPDVPVRKEPPPWERVSFRIQPPPKKLSTFPPSSPKSSVIKVPSLGVKTEPPADIPPGFEEEFRLRGRSSPSVKSPPGFGGGNSKRTD